MEFPDPVIAVAVEPKTKIDQEKMGIALGILLTKTHHLEFLLMKSLVKQLLREWASFI